MLLAAGTMIAPSAMGKTNDEGFYAFVVCFVSRLQGREQRFIVVLSGLGATP
jgi:hypothetical protein